MWFLSFTIAYVSRPSFCEKIANGCDISPGFIVYICLAISGGRCWYSNLAEPSFWLVMIPLFIRVSLSDEMSDAAASNVIFSVRMSFAMLSSLLSVLILMSDVIFGRSRM